MPGLTEHQTSVIRTLFATAPDSALFRMEQALAAGAEQGGALTEVYALSMREAAERRIRTTVLEPILPLCAPSMLGAIRFPPATVQALWSTLCGARPDDVSLAEAAYSGLDADEQSPAKVYDALCAAAAEGLRENDPAYARVAAILDSAGPDARAAFVDYLDLVPIARGALARLPEWLGRMSEERAAAARLAYRDAVTLAEDAGPRLIELLMAHLSEPWLILRILAAVVIRASDSYLAASELARFGEYILDDIDRRLAEFRTFDPDQGREAGVAAAEHLHVVVHAVAEFETALELSRDGPWGIRIAQQKQLLAAMAEGRLAQVDKAIDQALPMQLVRFGKGLKGLPKLTADPDPRLLRRAEGLMGFFDKSRLSAATSGFGSVRARVGEKVEARLDQYIEDLLDTLRAEDAVNIERIHAFLEAAAGLMGDVRGEKAAQIVRRRAAAA